MKNNLTFECAFQKDGVEEVVSKTITGDIDFVLVENWQYNSTIVFTEYANEATNDLSILYNFYKDLNYQCKNIVIYFINTEEKHVIFSRDNLEYIDFKTTINLKDNGEYIYDAETELHDGKFAKILTLR